MSKNTKFFLLESAFMLVCYFSLSQTVTFTRIDTGDLVSDLVRGRGISAVDIDNDGDLDLYIGASTGISVDETGVGINRPNMYYRNERNGRFTRIKEGIIPREIYGNSIGGVWGDYDNDGDWDMFFQNKLYVNDGFGNAEEVNVIHNIINDFVSAWVDYNADSYLDLFLTPIATVSGNYMFKNNGDGTFTEVNAGSITDAALYHFAQSICWSDFDNDGDLDFFEPTCAFNLNDLHPNRFYINDGNGAFSSIDGSSPLVSYSSSSFAGSQGDYDNDGDMDLYVLHNGVINYLFRNNGNLNFEKIIIDPPEAVYKTPLGSLWGDFDNDGDLDLFVTNCHNGIFGVNPAFTENLFFINNGNGTFIREISGDIITDSVSGASVTNDLDNDGDLDIVITNGNLGKPLRTHLYLNNGNENNWLSVKCIGTISNTSAIGVRIKAKAIIKGQPIWILRELTQETSMHARNGPIMHFGLGDAEQVDSLIIRWPLGQVDVYTDIKANQFYKAIEADTIKIDFAATNYIATGNRIHELVLEDDSLVIDLSPYFHYVKGDTVPEFTGDTIRYSIIGSSMENIIDADIYVDKLHIRQIGGMAGLTKLDIKACTEFTQALNTFYIIVPRPVTAGYGYAYQYSGGLNKYISEPIPELDSLSNLTVSFWIYLQTLPETVPQRILYKGDWNILISNDGGKIYFITALAEGGSSSIMIDKLKTNCWSHFAITVDSDTMRIFVNGEQKKAKAFPSMMHMKNTPNRSLIFWGDQNHTGLNYQVKGQLDDVRIWNKALTPGEIAASMEGPASELSDGLVGYWKFDEGLGEQSGDMVSAVSGKIDWYDNFNWKYSTAPVVYSSPDNLPIQVTLPGTGGTFELVQQGKEGIGEITNSSTGAFTYTPGTVTTDRDTLSYQVVKENFVSQEVLIVIKLRFTTNLKENKQHLSDNKISIYPNPAYDVINIIIQENLLENTSIAIMDISGRIVYQEKLGPFNGSGNYAIDISKYQPGVYLMFVINEMYSETAKILKMD